MISKKLSPFVVTDLLQKLNYYFLTKAHTRPSDWAVDHTSHLGSADHSGHPIRSNKSLPGDEHSYKTHIKR
jgi:hypothetical protein